jgi:DNA-binding transcriptional MerR regulator
MEMTVNRVAKMSGVSVRTLHHYDQIGLLSPERRSPSGYRLYGEGELLKLQQILFYRELEMPLEGIKAALDRPDFDPIAALSRHRALLERKADRISRLLSTIDKTLALLGGEKTMLSTEELYEGFPKEQAERWEREAKENWGTTEAYAQSRKRVGKMTKDQFAKVKEDGRKIEIEIAETFRKGLAPGSKETRLLIAKKVEHLRNFYEPNPEIVKGLGAMYEEHPEFRAFYEKLAEGLAAYLREAMRIFAVEEMKG